LKRGALPALGAVVMSTVLLASALGGGSTPEARAGSVGIHAIRRVVIIMQENRSFDSYFGTYPGADGIPGLGGNPGVVPFRMI